MLKQHPLRSIVGTAAAFGVVVSLMGSAYPAAAQVLPPPPTIPPSPTLAVEVHDSAVLLARGAAVVVPVSVTCSPSPFPIPIPFPGTPSVSVTLSQRWGRDLARGTGSQDAPCDGTPHVVEVLVSASEHPFKQGEALATASFFTCDFFGCHGATDTDEIRIRKS